MDLLLSCQYRSDEDSCEDDDENVGDTITPSVATLNPHSPETNIKISTEKKRHIHETMTTKPSYSQSVATSQNQPNSKSFKKQKFTRLVPHIRGNWCGHIFFAIDPKSTAHNHAHAAKLIHRAARCKIQHVQKCLSSNPITSNVELVSHFDIDQIDTDSQSDSESSDCHRHPSCDTNLSSKTKYQSTDHLHISLSKPFYLQEQSIQPFIHTLKQRLSLEHPVSCTFDTTYADATTFNDFLVNESQTRSFLTMGSSSSSSSSSWDVGYERILSCVDIVMSKYNQPLYYKNPKLHISIASMVDNINVLLGQPTCVNNSINNDANRKENLKDNESNDGNTEEEIDDDSDEEDYIPESITIRFDHVYCTFGTTKIFSIPLGGK